jgi:hypothetical protein
MATHKSIPDHSPLYPPSNAESGPDRIVQHGGGRSKKLVKILAGSMIASLAIAGTTLGIISMVELSHTRHTLTETRHTLTQTRHALAQTQGQLSTTQTEVQCMSPTINYLSQFGGSYGLNSTDDFGNVTGTWYMPAMDTGQPLDNGRSQMGTCSG